MKTNWAEIEKIRRKAFHGTNPTAEELKKCEQAMKENPEFYKQIGIDLRTEYKNNFKL